jgi:hypothetical protein
MFYLYKHIKVTYACRRNSCATEYNVQKKLDRPNPNS